MTTKWLTEGAPEKILLDAMQRIAFESLDDIGEAKRIAQDALHDSGFATLKTTYDGGFRLAWLRDGERVGSAGDGSGAAIVTAADGTERRVNVGDEVPL